MLSVDIYRCDRHTVGFAMFPGRRPIPGGGSLHNPWIGIDQPVKMAGNRVSYTLDSTLESVNTAENTAEQMAAKAGFDDEERHKISMAVREAAVNAVLHGNSYDPGKKMRVAFENTGEALVITISDEGPGLTENELPDPLSPENLLKQSGRGIFLIRSFMDEVHFRTLQPGTEITLVKNVRGDSANQSEAIK
jgi:serine/threonine-protein kinase RsbW